jgi:hypothetical protein
LQRLVRKGLDETAALWPEVRTGFDRVFEVAAVLANPEGQPASAVKGRWQGVLRRVRQQARRRQGPLAKWLKHFAKVSKSYGAGLFTCYAVAGVPRTNNGLEQLFGSHRYHERRCSGRKAASPGLVIRGAVRLVAGVATRLTAVSGDELAPRQLAAWRQLRGQLRQRQHGRVQRRRFRRDPQAYLQQLEQDLLQSALLS